MPELPEVETVVRGLRECAAGRAITRVHVLRPDIIRGYTPEFERRLISLFIEDVLRRGKNIIIRMSGGYALVVHLKMTGQLTCNKAADEMLKHTHLVMELDDGRELRFRDIRRFGYVVLVRLEDVAGMSQIASMGPEPLEVGFQEFAARVGRGGRRIKAVLLDQRILAGLGNIYADESLHRAGINPETPVNELSAAAMKRLYDSVREVLAEAIACGGSSVDNYIDARGQRGTFQLCHRVYRRTGQPCPRCGTPIERLIVGGRGTHFCPKCQPKRRCRR